jgi:hypothetical protein
MALNVVRGEALKVKQLLTETRHFCKPECVGLFFAGLIAKAEKEIADEKQKAAAKKSPEAKPEATTEAKA